MGGTLREETDGLERPSVSQCKKLSPLLAPPDRQHPVKATAVTLQHQLPRVSSTHSTPLTPHAPHHLGTRRHHSTGTRSPLHDHRPQGTFPGLSSSLEQSGAVSTLRMTMPFSELYLASWQSGGCATVPLCQIRSCGQEYQATVRTQTEAPAAADRRRRRLASKAAE